MLLCQILGDFLQTATPAKRLEEAVLPSSHQNSLSLKLDWHCPCLVNTKLTGCGALHCVLLPSPVEQMVFKHQMNKQPFKDRFPSKCSVCCPH